MVAPVVVSRQDFDASASSFADYLLNESFAHYSESLSNDEWALGELTGASSSAYDLDALEELGNIGFILDELFISTSQVPRKKVRFSSEEIRFFEKLPCGGVTIVKREHNLLPPLVPRNHLPFAERRWNAPSTSQANTRMVSPRMDS